jgi:hypothetical protein
MIASPGDRVTEFGLQARSDMDCGARFAGGRQKFLSESPGARGYFFS